MTQPVITERRRRIFRLNRFPVTVLLALQYGGLVLVPGMIHGNESLMFVSTALAVAVGLTAVTEACFAHRPSAMSARGPVGAAGALVVLCIGLAAHGGRLLTGDFDYTAFVRGTGRSFLGSLLTPLLPWVIAGSVLLFYKWRKDQRALAGLRLPLLGAAGVVILAVDLLLGGLSGPARVFLSLSAILLCFQMVRARTIVAVALIALVSLPVLYEVRNLQRVAAGGTRWNVAQSEDRLRLDEFFGSLEGIERPEFAERPSTLTILRYGLIPRFLDSGRPEVSTGRILYAHTTGGRTSSAIGYTTLGNVLLFEGWLGLSLWAIGIATGFSLCRTSGHPLGWLIAAFIAYHFIYIESTYPDNLSAFLQSVVAGACAYAAMVVIDKRMVRRVRMPLS